MKGKYSLEIISRRVIYRLEMERKVTVIKGNSGTGKTSMIRLLSDYLELGKDSGVSVKRSDVFGLEVFRNTTDWATAFSALHNTIVFIDEDVRFLYDRNFQSMFQTADCYVVIISRSGMFQQLPYAVNSVYEFRTHLNNKMYITQMYHLYHETLQQYKADCVITEDSNAGYEMIRQIYTCPVYPAGGNSSVIRYLLRILPKYELIHLVVDGAAFGGFIEPILNLGMLKNNLVVYAPESFECLLLKTSAFQKYLTDELKFTWKYCDSARYITWERYYTDLLYDLCRTKYAFSYTKKKLHAFFINRPFIEQVQAQLTEVVSRANQIK